jgi:disulfide bond formation protein DsbB
MEIVKFFHFFGLMLGAGAGLGGMAATIAHKRVGGGPPSDTIKAIKPIFGIFGLSGISLLWITGLIMTPNVDPALLGALFYVKLLVAVTMLAISLFLMVVAKKSTKAGVPPPSYFDAVGRTSGLLAIVAVALAVMIFG